VGSFKSSEQLIEKLTCKLKSSKSSCEAISLAVAIGLISLRSGNRIAANALDIPCNKYLLDWFPPEVLMVRVICRCLVMWDSIEPSKEWFILQIPSFLSDSVEERPLNLSPGKEHLVHSYYSVVGGLCFALGLKYASTENPKALELINDYYDEISPLCNLKCKDLK
jgi:anaphase-promoting complex subunit 1